MKNTTLFSCARNGQIMAVLMAPTDRHHDLKLASYPAGMYLYSLVVDGVPSLTRRLVVE